MRASRGYSGRMIFPDSGKIPAVSGSSPPSRTLTLIPHDRPFRGMRDCHPGPAFGRGGCINCLSYSFPWAVAPAVSPVPAHGDYDGAAAAGAESPGVQVIGECDARGPQLVDQACDIGGSGEPYGAVALRPAFADEEDGHGGQVRQDPVLPHIGVLRPGGIGAGGAGVAVTAPVSGLAVGPG